MFFIPEGNFSEKVNSEGLFLQYVSLWKFISPVIYDTEVDLKIVNPYESESILHQLRAHPLLWLWILGDITWHGK